MIAATLCFTIVAASLALELRRHRLEQRAKQRAIRLQMRRRIHQYRQPHNRMPANTVIQLVAVEKEAA